MVVGVVPSSTCRPPERSRPDASCTAPRLSATAITPKIAFENCGMFCPQSKLSPHGDQRHNASGTATVLPARDHLTVFKKNFAEPGTPPGAWESSRQPVFPPAPLIGDVGRGCGDASRAL